MRVITAQQWRGIHGLDAQKYVAMMRRVTFGYQAPTKARANAHNRPGVAATLGSRVYPSDRSALLDAI
jgi:hypothetical protein